MPRGIPTSPTILVTDVDDVASHSSVSPTPNPPQEGNGLTIELSPPHAAPLPPNVGLPLPHCIKWDDRLGLSRTHLLPAPLALLHRSTTASTSNNNQPSPLISADLHTPLLCPNPLSVSSLDVFLTLPMLLRQDSMADLAARGSWERLGLVCLRNEECGPWNEERRMKSVDGNGPWNEECDPSQLGALWTFAPWSMVAWLRKLCVKKIYQEKHQ
jgi:hypothetical protein